MVTQPFHRNGNNTVSKKLIATAIAVASMTATTSFAEGLDSSMFSVKGFGTVGVVHSSEEKADFVSTPYQPKGAGLSHDWESYSDSKLGVQLNANFVDKFSAIVQVVTQYQYDNTWTPVIEWANVKYQVTPDLSVRLGRIVLPAFLISDSRNVGYANPWVRPPEEVYFNTLTTNNDGGDITYRKQFGEVINTVQAYYGQSTAKFSDSKMQGNPDWGINDTVEIDALTLRAGYSSYQIDFKSSGLDLLYGGLAQFAEGTAPFFPQASADAYALLNKYPLNDMKIGIYTLGANYDPGAWFVMGEYVHVKGESIIADSNSAYVTAGYRIEKFTPYVTFAEVKTDAIKEDGISTAGLPGVAADGATALNAGINAILSSTSADQRTASIGVRWDFMLNADLKVQYDRKSLFDNSTGRLLIIPAGASYQGSNNFNVISTAIDFVF